MNNGFDIRDLQLEVGTEIQIIIREFIKELQLPHLKAKGRKAWMNSSDDEKEKLYNEFGNMKDLMK